MIWNKKERNTLADITDTDFFCFSFIFKENSAFIGQEEVVISQEELVYINIGEIGNLST